MNNRTALRNAALATALAAVAASAWAMNGSLSNSTWIPAPEPAVTTTATPPTYEETLTVPGETVVADQPLPSNERVMPLEAASLPPAAPSASQPRITVEERRLTLDERIQADLLDKLAQAPNLSGRIGVESRDAVVTLSGWTATSGQAHRAVRYAWSVAGVKDVQNEIRARVGGST